MRGIALGCPQAVHVVQEFASLLSHEDLSSGGCWDGFAGRQACSLTLQGCTRSGSTRS